MKNYLFSCSIILAVFPTQVFSIPSSSSETEDAPEARTETDLEKIYSSFGVPIYYYYNETRAGNEQNGDHQILVSAPGCPQSIDGFPWVYYGDPPRCFLAGHHGPCKFGEKLVLQRDSHYGICACECLLINSDGYNSISDAMTLLDTSVDDRRYIFCSASTEAAYRGQIYDRKSNKCYGAYEQGPCKNGTVIANWEDDSLTCLPLCDAIDKNIEHWQSLIEEGLCIMRPSFGSSAGVVSQNSCPGGKFSKILQKCVGITTIGGPVG